MKKFTLPLILGLVAVVIVAAIVLAAKATVKQEQQTAEQIPAAVSSPPALPDLLTGDAPWSNNATHLADRLNAIGMPQLGAEGSVLHIHQHLDIFIHGRPVAVPQFIGIPDPETFISIIHTHDTTGILHVESPTQQTFYLGQAFDTWGVQFNQNCVGGYCADANNQLSVYVNGTKQDGNPREIKLESHQEIAVVYGTPAEAPASIPSSYTFPGGY